MNKLEKTNLGCWPASIVPRRRILTATGLAALTVGLSNPVAGHTITTEAEAISQPIDPSDENFMERAFDMRQAAIDYGDQAYGAVLVRDKVIVGQSWSRVILDQDPTAHAEMAAIRDAANRLVSRDLGETVMYSSSRPCPMCEAAAFWAGVSQMIYGRDIKRAGSPKLCE
ncbi:nucleoside deaminase [Ruegeria hyattellae]|uniref:nucleoside deaminase n=1 Tax=Ruegeria hyattellae TaxID=3233337 RepID=UPI00355B2697